MSEFEKVRALKLNQGRSPSKRDGVYTAADMDTQQD